MANAMEWSRMLIQIMLVVEIVIMNQALPAMEFQTCKMIKYVVLANIFRLTFHLVVL